MATAVPAEFLPTLVAELASAIEAVGGTSIVVADGAGVSGPGWTVPLVVTGSLRGTARLTLDEAGVTALLHLILGPDADTGENAARDLLTELSSQATSSLCLKEPFAKLSVSVGAIARSEAQPDQKMSFALPLGESSLQIVAGATLEAMEAATPVTASTPAPAPAPASSPATVPPPAPRRVGGTTAVPTNNLEVVLDIELPLAVRFGSTVMSIRALSQLGPGSIVDMGRSPDDPVEILVCGKPIAKAEVVIVSGNYGVRITDLTSPAERIRAMEGQL